MASGGFDQKSAATLGVIASEAKGDADSSSRRDCFVTRGAPRNDTAPSGSKSALVSLAAGAAVVWTRSINAKVMMMFQVEQ
jgi:hypothetical protein